MKTGLLTLTLSLSAAASAQIHVSNYAPGQNEEGITYFLPTTALRITVETEKTTFTPGDFCRYAEKYLQLAGVSSEASELWKIKGIRIVPVGQPDKSQAYTIEIKDKTSAPLVELTSDGIIKAVNTHNPNKYDPEEEVPEDPEKTLNPRDYMTEDILMAGSTAKMAELTAREIYSIRESKNSLTRGQSEYMPKDGESLRIMLDNLKTQEEALLQLFKGKTVKEEHKFTLQLTPTGNIEKDVLFRFSKIAGVVGANNLAGEPVYVSLTSLNNVPDPNPDEKSKKKLDGVVYNIPGKAQICIFHGKEKYYEGEFSFAQFGNTEILNKKLFDKKTGVKVIFNPATGGIIEITDGER